MEHVPPPAEELALLDHELARLETRRTQLLARRAWLVSVLSQPVARPAAPFGPPQPVRPPVAFAAPPVPPHAPGETRNAQNVLLALGGLLLAIAAIAFTLVSWGEMGIGGRSAVLTAVTVAALAAPAPLLRRGLPATAESLAALASVLLVLDAYAFHRVVMPQADGAGFAAVASAALAVLWTGYGLLMARLRLPLPLAVVSAQLPLPLCAWWAGAGASAFGWALLITAAVDGAIALRGRGVAVRVTACVGCWVVGPVGLLVGLVQSVSADTAWTAVAPGVLLLAGAAVAVAGAWRAPSGFAVAGGLVAGWCAVAAVGGVLSAEVPAAWSVPVYLLCGAALPVGLRTPVPRRVGEGLLWSSSAVVAGAVLASLPPVGLTLLTAVSQLARVWAGTPAAAEQAWSQMAPAPVTLLSVAALSGAAYRWWERAVRLTGRAAAPGSAWRSAAGAAAVALGWAGCTVAPTVPGLPHPAAVAAQLALATSLFAVAVCSLRRGVDVVGPTALVCGLVGAATAGVSALATEATTYAAFGTLTVVLGAVAVMLDGAAPSAARTSPTASAVEAARTARTARALRIAQAVPAFGAVLCATVTALAAGASLGLSAHRAAPLLLIVPTATAVLGAWLPNRPPTLAVESAGGVAAAVALGMAVPDRMSLALVSSLCGVVAAGTAVRPERRPGAGYLSTGLFVLATWLYLSASGVSAPEAYTLPVTVPALVVGALWHRRDTGASSWAAYGPGLAVTLVPSLFAAWSDPHWVRPLLLGAAALAVTLAGARLRLQAPLLLGGAVSALDALHELAPYVVQVVGALPRWMPLALAGVLLLAVGATYEQRLRDARRLKKALGRMR
ncbi:SCO7613 C-terminal domain-containing membrane protein [Streptomyces sp. NPDC056061]|uniref:SCO7613 C-terminal domain-containing membrane protein n=1 Tax=Streptomyces sp. NPDC056061 TaxID=3345700 RepID=UPI0035DA8D23